jgi:two-component system sensor histidine kinase BaeS
VDNKRFGSLGARVAAALIGVALAAIAVFAAVMIIIERSDVGRLAATQQAQTAAAVVSALEDTYPPSRAWTGADLEPAAVLAENAGAALAISAPDGVVLLRSGPAELLRASGAAKVRRPVVVLGHEVGVVLLAFPAGALSPADRRLRTELAEALGVSSGLAVLGAILLAALATPALVRPIRRLTAAARALETGASYSRLGERAGPGELRDLGCAFDAMAAALEHNEQLRRTMVADVAHELRTPLAILQGETEALVDGVSAPTPAALASLHDESLRLGRLVEDLQTLASAEAAGLSLERHAVDLATIAAGAAESLAGRFRATGVDLERVLSPGLVWADPDRMRQVVVNLFTNAVKFTTPGGRVELLVRVAGSSVYLEVLDTGPGVPADEREQIFERFFRGGAGRRSGGAGIGLAVVKELVHAHKGDIEVQGLPGEGARFVLRLPLATELGQD